MEKLGFRYVRNGGNHDVYRNGKITETVPRHNEIPEYLAKKILKRFKK